MSNEIKSGNMNDPNRATEAPKSGQQSQGTTPQTHKAPSQQGGSDHKSGQQSQGGSRGDDDGMKQAGGMKKAGSTTIVSDPKKAADVTQKSGSPK
jgi:hypothetical protein